MKSVILKQMIDRSRVVYTYSQALHWCVGAASALADMHESDPMIIHRDLKCDNMLLTGSGECKIADLGLHALVQKQNTNLEGDDQIGRRSGSILKHSKSYEVIKQSRRSKVKDALSNAQAEFEAETGNAFWKMTGN